MSGKNRISFDIYLITATSIIIITRIQISKFVFEECISSKISYCWWWRVTKKESIKSCFATQSLRAFSKSIRGRFASKDYFPIRVSTSGYPTSSLLWKGKAHLQKGSQMPLWIRQFLQPDIFVKIWNAWLREAHRSCKKWDRKCEKKVRWTQFKDSRWPSHVYRKDITTFPIKMWGKEPH